MVSYLYWDTGLLALEGTHWTSGIQGLLASRYVRGRPAAV